MKYIFTVLILLINFETMTKQISELNWKKRLLLISYQNDGDQIFIRTTKFISDNRCEIEDRNLQIVFFEKFKNKDYIIPKYMKNKNGIWLIGYDGNVKDYSIDDSILPRLFNLIDSMPIRQNEMKHDKC